jgi:hypothetical protein
VLYFIACGVSDADDDKIDDETTDEDAAEARAKPSWHATISS